MLPALPHRPLSEVQTIYSLRLRQTSWEEDLILSSPRHSRSMVPR